MKLNFFHVLLQKFILLFEMDKKPLLTNFSQQMTPETF